MKKEFLENFKVGDQALPKEVVEAIMQENQRDIEGAELKYHDYDDLKKQLEEANKTISGFKDLNVEEIQKQAEAWKEAAEKAKKEADQRIADMEFNGLLDNAIREAKGRNSKAVRALLDLDSLKGSKNQSADIKAALESLKKENNYLFESTDSPPPFVLGNGTQVTQQDQETVAAIRAAAGLNKAKENK